MFKRAHSEDNNGEPAEKKARHDPEHGDIRVGAVKEEDQKVPLKQEPAVTTGATDLQIPRAKDIAHKYEYVPKPCTLFRLESFLAPEGTEQKMVEIVIPPIHQPPSEPKQRGEEKGYAPPVIHNLSGANPQVRARQLWGNGVYTWDSDIVSVITHLGYWNQNMFLMRPGGILYVRVFLTPLPPMDNYVSCSRNSIRSRAWGSLQKGCSYRVERVFVVTNTEGQQTIELEASPDSAASVIPTWTPAHFERAISTRAAASSLERRQRTLQEVTLQYNLCNEPWLKYSMAAIADRGLKPSQWTSARFHREVLFFESHLSGERFEISRVEPLPDAPVSDKGEVYRLAKCTAILPLARMWRVGVPLPETYLDILYPSLYWEDLQWSATGVTVKGRSFLVARLHWTDRKQTATEGAADTTGRPLA